MQQTTPKASTSLPYAPFSSYLSYAASPYKIKAGGHYIATQPHACVDAEVIVHKLQEIKWVNKESGQSMFNTAVCKIYAGW